MELVFYCNYHPQCKSLINFGTYTFCVIYALGTNLGNYGSGMPVSVNLIYIRVLYFHVSGLFYCYMYMYPKKAVPTILRMVNLSIC